VQGIVAGRPTVKLFGAPREWARLGCPVIVGFSFPFPFTPRVDKDDERRVAFFVTISDATSLGDPS